MKLKPEGQTTDPGPPCDEDWIIPDYLVEFLAEHTATGVELVDVFTADTVRQISELREAASKSVIQKAKDLLHGLAGSCGQMGAVSIADCCARLEANMDFLTASEILLQVDKLGQCCDHLIECMNARSYSARRSIGS
jgi:HPt (histidine-containing phosphotransfer) domain-containing protein